MDVAIKYQQMSLTESVQKLKGSLMETDTIHEQNYQLFSTMDVQKTAKKLSLINRGTERGSKELPSSNDENFDEVEQQIINLVEKDLDRNQKVYDDQTSIYIERIGLAGSTSDYTKIEIEVRDAIADFRKTIDEGRSQLERKEENLRETADERRKFRKKHSLERTAHYPELGSRILRLGLLALLFLVESLANTPLLAKGSEFGLTGGVTQAITIALLNIGVATVTGYVGLRELFHRNLFRKLLGTIWLTLWVTITIVFNLLVAHYRELSEVLITDPGIPQQIINGFIANPIGLNDFPSWILFGIGILFALIALLDMFTLDDAYPFYGKLDRKYQRLCQEYTDMRSDLVHDLSTPRTEIVDEIAMAIDEINKQQDNRIRLQASCKTTLREYQASIKSLNNQCNQLLQIYREANRDARSTEAPERFNERIELDRSPLDHPNFSPFNTDFHANNLRKSMEEFFDEFDSLRKEIPLLSDVTKVRQEDGSTQNST